MSLPSSTSSSDPAPYRFAARAAAFGAFFVALCQLWRLGGFGYPAIPAPERAEDRYYLAYDNYFYDHVRYIAEPDGPIANAKTANLLFLGNSRLMLGVEGDELLRAVEGTSATPHVMGFGFGEKHRLPMELIRDKQMAPKLVVMNADADFFRGGYSNYGESLQKLGSEGALAQAARTAAKNTAWRAWMRIAPIPQVNQNDSRMSKARWEDARWPLILIERTRMPMIWRSERLGDWTIPEPQYAYKERGQFVKPAGEQIPADYAEQLANARVFVELIRSRGGDAVFTIVPNAETNANLARKLGADLGVEVVDVPWTNMMTFDSSHLTEYSAERFTRALMAELKRTAAWRRAFGGT